MDEKVKSTKPLPKWAKIVIIVVCSVIIGLGLFTALWHLSLYILSFENDVHREDMVIESVTSIEEYNENNSTAFKCFDNSTSTTIYSYNDKLVFIEEESVVNGVEVALLVTVYESTYGIDYVDIFDKTYSPSILDAPSKQYDNSTRVQTFEGKTYIHISDDNWSYDLIVGSLEEGVWQEILTLFNS